LRGHFYPHDQNVVYINNTVNVTNITYNNSVVYNYGPDYAVVSKYSTRPIPRLKLERANLDPLQAVKAGSVTKVQGDKLVLAAPLKLQKSNTQIAPKAVKAKIDQPKIEKGWANISDPNKAKLEQKLKTENPKNVPTPSNQPNAAANVNALASPGVSPFEKGRGKQKGQASQNKASTSIAPGAPPAASMTPFEQGHGKKGKAQTVENEPRASITPRSSSAESFEQGKGKQKGQRFETGPRASVAPGSPPNERFEQGQGKHKGQKFENAPGASVAHGSSESLEQGNGKKNKGRVEHGEQTPVPGGAITPRNPNANLENQNNPQGGKHKGNRHDEIQPGSQNAGGGAGGGKRRAQIQSQGPPPQGGQYGQQGGQGKGKGKKGEISPTPSPR